MVEQKSPTKKKMEEKRKNGVNDKLVSIWAVLFISMVFHFRRWNAVKAIYLYLGVFSVRYFSISVLFICFL